MPNEFSSDLEVLWMSDTEYSEGGTIKSHAHTEYYQIHYITEGEGLFILNGEEFHLTENMLLLATPGATHGMTSVGNAQHRGMRMFEIKFAVLGTDLSDQLAALPPAMVGADSLQRLLSAAFREALNKDLYYVDITRSVVHSFVYRLIRAQKNYEPLPDHTGWSPNVATVIKDYVNQNYTRGITLDSLSAHTGYSKNYLCRVFREATGLTINTYLNQVRIGKAVELLANTTMEVAEISAAVGYNNVYHFIKTFKKMIGIPPGNYRRQELTGIGLANDFVSSQSIILHAGLVLSRLP